MIIDIYHSIIVLSIIFSLLASGCTDISQTVLNDNSGNVIITDGFGREVSIPSQINSIVCSGSSGVRYVVYVDAVDLLSGVQRSEQTNSTSTHDTRPYTIANPQFEDLPMISSSDTGENLEQIMVLNPQIIFMLGSSIVNESYGTYSDADIMQARTGIPVVSTPSGSFLTEEGRLEMYSSFRLMGKIFGREEHAEELISYIEGSLTDLEKRTGNISESEQKEAYIGGLSHSGPHGITSSQPKYPPFEWVHVKNIVGNYDLNYIEFSKESILFADPEFIFIDAGTLNLVDEIGAFEDINSPLFSDLQAVKKSNVFTVMPYNHGGNNAETVLADAYYVGKTVYPERFEDIDPKKKADEIYEMFVGKPVFDELNANCNNLGFKKVNLS